MDGEVELSPDSDMLKIELLEAGFPQGEIIKALEWLDSLADRRAIEPVSTPSFRIFSSEERQKLDQDCIGFLMSLEHSGILSPESRELVLDRAMAIHDQSLTLENLRWVILMVLFSQPEEETAFARMESLVYDHPSEHFH